MRNTITIIGGGPVGLASALHLAQGSLSLNLLDAKLSTQANNRVIALSYASYCYLEELGLSKLQDNVTYIKTVHISTSGFGVSKIEAKDLNLPFLGCTIKYSTLVDLLKQNVINNPSINYLPNCKVTQVYSQTHYAAIEYSNLNYENQPQGYLTSSLAIMADGGGVLAQGFTYNKIIDYSQVALTMQVKCENKGENIAYEHFEKDSAIILLPHNDVTSKVDGQTKDEGGHFTLLWIIDKKLAKDSRFEVKSKLETLNFMKRFGEFEIVSEVFSFPLTLKLPNKRVTKNIVLVGNSAQTIHPLAAQGLNLGLRDVKVLGDLLIKNNGVFSATSYDKLRISDSRFVSYFTHLLSLAINGNSIVHNLKPLALGVMEASNLLKDTLSQRLIFGF